MNQFGTGSKKFCFFTSALYCYFHPSGTCQRPANETVPWYTDCFLVVVVFCCFEVWLKELLMELLMPFIARTRWLYVSISAANGIDSCKFMLCF